MQTPQDGHDRNSEDRDRDRDQRTAAALRLLHEALREAVERRPEVLEALEVLVSALRPEPRVEEEPPRAAPPEPGEEPGEEPAAAREEAPDDAPEPVVEDIAYPAEAAPAAGRVAETPPEAYAYTPEPEPEPEAPWRSRRVRLDLIARRAGLKAEALEWAIRRRELDRPGVDFDHEIKPVDQGLLDRAKTLDDCFLWMLLPHGPQDRLKEFELEELEQAYRAVQLAAEAAGAWDVEDEDRFSDGSLARFLTLVAEAQSGLLASMRASGLGGDEDQYELWCWVRQVTDRKRIFLDEYMSRERMARPSQLADYPERLGSFVDQLEERDRRQKERQQRVKRVAYHVKRIEDALDRGMEAEDPSLNHEWNKVATTLDEWVSAGGQVTDRGLLEEVARVASEFPDGLVEGHVARVLEAADRWLESRAEERQEDRAEAGSPQAEDGPASTSEAFERVLARHPDRLVLALNNRSDPEYDYSRPAEVEEALEWLATDLWEARAGKGNGLDHRTLNHRLMERCGWFYRPAQSSTTMGRFPEWYRCVHGGRTLTLSPHIGRGNTKRQGRHSIRIAFAWDEPSKRIVIGFLGQHQKTTQT